MNAAVLEPFWQQFLTEDVMDEMPQAEVHDSNARADERQKGDRDEPPFEQSSDGSGRADGRDVPPAGSDHDPESPWLGGG